MQVITMNQVSDDKRGGAVKFYGIEFREKHFRRLETRCRVEGILRSGVIALLNIYGLSAA